MRVGPKRIGSTRITTHDEIALSKHLDSSVEFN